MKPLDPKDVNSLVSWSRLPVSNKKFLFLLKIIEKSQKYQIIEKIFKITNILHFLRNTIIVLIVKNMRK